MCIEVRKTCECGAQSVQLHLRDNILSREVVASLHCPECMARVAFDEETMINDNSWIIGYDMELARFLVVSRLPVPPETVTPEFIFDSGYATWLEMYPGEQQEVLEDRQEIMRLLELDKNEYLRQLTRWNIARVERLKKAGWRKAQSA